jgi:aminoglycoside/choline kinase family phosphotransferase
VASFPSHPDAIELDWLSEKLRAAGVLDGEVRSFRWEPIGTGQVGDSARMFLEYDRAGAGPLTIAAKYSAADATSRATAAALGLYAKEVGFYRELRQLVDVRVPQPLAAEIDPGGVEFLLLFEDLGPARGGNQLLSCSPADARAGIGQAAALHAPSWNNPAVVDLPWLQTPPGVLEQVRALYGNAHALFRERYADLLEPEFMAVCDELNEAREHWYGRDNTDRCLMHGDFRLDNMLFAIKGGAEEIAVLDWQTVTVGNALVDIGYFLGTGIGDELRRAHEGELLDLYCAEMTARGVPLSRDAIWDDYVVGALHGVSTAVFSAAYVQRTERGDANFLSMARGGCALALQHGSLAKLRG